MARRSKVIIIVSTLLLSLCWEKLSAQDESELVSRYGFIGLPDGRHILLRYSTIDDVIFSLGAPSGKEYFAKGGEDFFWTDFWIYSYINGNLRFYFENKSKRVIRINANILMTDGFTFPFNLDGTSELEAILDPIRMNVGIVNVGNYRNSITYGLDNVKKFIGVIVFYSQREIRYDISYYIPW